MWCGLPSSEVFWRWVYRESLVGQFLKLRYNSPYEPIVDYKEDAGALGLFLVVSVGDRPQNKQPKETVDGFYEVYHPYPREMVNGRASELLWTSHTIRPSNTHQPVSPGRTVFRAEPGPL
jgi:hypothetical protein